MDVHLHRLRSRTDGSIRTLRVLIPAAPEPMPVVYLHDGQNVFDAAGEVTPTWGVDDALSEWIASGGRPWIAVGVDHRGVERIADDSPWPEQTAHTPARGPEYAQIVAAEVTAFIDQTYATIATREGRAIVGSSLGGLMALYMGATWPDTFSRVGAFSPTTMWADSSLFALWTPATRRPDRLYVDVGRGEYFENGETVLDYGHDVPKFVDHLRALGYGDDVLKFVLDPHGEHSEADWRRRFAAALPFLLA